MLDDVLEVKRELSFDDMDGFLLGGALQKWEKADEGQREAIWEELLDVFDGTIPTETDVNDYVWWDCSACDESYNKLKSRVAKLEKLLLNRKSVKNEGQSYISPRSISQDGKEARKEIIRMAQDILDAVKNRYNGRNMSFSRWMRGQCSDLQDAAETYEEAMKDWVDSEEYKNRF